MSAGCSPCHCLIMNICTVCTGIYWTGVSRRPREYFTQWPALHLRPGVWWGRGTRQVAADLPICGLGGSYHELDTIIIYEALHVVCVYAHGLPKLPNHLQIVDRPFHFRLERKPAWLSHRGPLPDFSSRPISPSRSCVLCRCRKCKLTPILY